MESIHIHRLLGTVQWSVIAVMLAAIGIAQGALADDDYIVTQTIIDEQNTPKNITTIINECNNNPNCKAIKDIVQIWTKIPINEIEAGITTITKDSNSNDQDRYYNIELPSGYKFCHAEIFPTNMVPSEGNNAPELTVKAFNIENQHRSGLNMYLVLRRQGVTEGTTRIEATMKILGVNDRIAEQKYADGSCTNVGSEFVEGPIILHCRGNPCPPKQY